MNKKNSIDLNNISGRIRYLRKLTGLERQEVEARHQIKVESLDKWENARGNISTRNIARLLSMALDHSIECTAEWLISGEGPPPKTISPSSINQPLVGTRNTAEKILRDLSYFRNAYPDGLTLMVSDDSMAPYYVNGDFVGGEIVDLSNLKNILDRACIVQTLDGKLRVRRVGYAKGSWFLYGTNVKHNGSPYIELDVEIEKVAPIFWLRMKS